MISQRAVDLMVSCEVSSRAEYERKYQRPEWPGGRSGVTVAIGYDLGMASKAKITADWKGRVSDAMLGVMVSCSGVSGDAARTLLPSVRGMILIPWSVAMDVFLNRDVPEWTSAVIRKIPAAAGLPPDCLGALVDTAYNRGASFDNAGDRYAEMRAIKSDVTANHLEHVPYDFRSMERLWPDMRGLRDRCEARAKLWDLGLSAPHAAPEAHSANEKPKPAIIAPAGTKEHGSAAGSGAVAGKVIHDTVPPEHIWSMLEIMLAVGGAVAVAAIVWYAIRVYRTQAGVTARAKDHPEPVVEPVSA